MSLTAISPVDGRYSKITKPLEKYFSEYALVEKRVWIELEYLKKLGEIKIINISRAEKKKIDEIGQKFNFQEAKKIKKIEVKTKHDVKAVEYYLQEKFQQKKLERLVPLIHIGLTSADINNLAVVLSVKESRELILGDLKEILKLLKQLALKNKGVAMAGRTHGQTAVPTTFGKEIAVFYHRLSKQFKKLENFVFEGKLNGAVGNYNAQQFAFPNVNWPKFSRDFLNNLGLDANLYTTQILPYDNLIEYFQTFKLVNSVLIDLAQDIWFYDMLGIVKLEKGISSVGSSTMPQKVNPIEFENAEGNLYLTNGLIEVYERKLLISRLQRDLSDSTISRSFGEMFGHLLIGWGSLRKGLSLARINKSSSLELENNWQVLAEAVQTYLRTRGESKAYDLVKEKTMGRKMNEEEYLKLVNGKLKLPKENRLVKLKPKNYLGLAEKLTEKLFKK